MLTTIAHVFIQHTFTEHMCTQHTFTEQLPLPAPRQVDCNAHEPWLHSVNGKCMESRGDHSVNLTFISQQVGNWRAGQGRGRRDRWTEQAEEDGEEGAGGLVTFFGFQLLQHPCLLALFAVGL